MASFTLRATTVYPVGTSVTAHRAYGDPPLGNPTTAVVDTQTMGASSLTFTGLTAGTTYWAYAVVDGRHRYVSFIPAGEDATEDGEQDLVVSVIDYGADPTGVEASDGAFADAVDACLTAITDPASTTRTANRRLWIPCGDYRFESPWIIRSVQGLHVEGEAEGQTRLRWDGASTSTDFIDLRGIAYSTFENLWIRGQDGEDNTCRAAVHLHKTADAGRSVRNVKFRNCMVTELGFVNGFGLELDDGSKENSWIYFDNCSVRGSYENGETTLFQSGWKCGSGIGGNAMGFCLVEPQAEHVRYAMWIRGHGGAVYGGLFGSCKIAFKSEGIWNWFHADGMRMEEMAKLWESTGNTATSVPIELSNIYYTVAQTIADTYPPDAKVIEHHKGGQFSVDGLVIKDVTGEPFSPVAEFSVDPSGRSIVHLNRVSCRTAVKDFVVNQGGANVQWELRNYNCLDTSPVAYVGSIVTSTRTKAVTYAASVTADPYLYETALITLTGNITINNPSSPIAGQILRFVLTQDATGTRTTTFGAAFKASWTPDTTANKINVITFQYTGSAWVQVSATTGLS